jgi:hypothetical protein
VTKNGSCDKLIKNASMKKSIRMFIVLFIIGLPKLLFARRDDPINFDGESPYGVTDVPFDDGVGLLVAVGVVYGILKIRAYKKAEKSKRVTFPN